MRISEEEQVAAEAAWAKKLLAAPAETRKTLYGEAYDDIYRMALTRADENIESQTYGATRGLVGLLAKLTKPGAECLEVGCGTAMLAIELAKLGRRVTGVEVSQVALTRARHYAGCTVEFQNIEGTILPFAESSFDFVYSVEVVEHLHECDVALHLREVLRVLRPSGRYWMLTPNRKFSRHAAERFGIDGHADADVHLKEWTHGEMSALLRKTGFSQLRSPWRNNSLHRLPLLPAFLFAATERLPTRLAQLAGATSCSIVGTKTLRSY